jgi:hypothetical protein
VSISHHNAVLLPFWDFAYNPCATSAILIIGSGRKLHHGGLGLPPWSNTLLGGNVAKKHVEFEAHQTVKKPTEVSFTTKDGKRVDFEAEKKTKVLAHVEFDANTKK